MRSAAFALAEVNFAAGDINYAVREKVTTAQLKVRSRLENVSGVQLPSFECVMEGVAPPVVAAPVGATGDGGGAGRISPAGSDGSTGSTHSTTVGSGATQWLGRGGQQVQKCREAFQKSLQALVELASLQTAFFVLDETIRATNRRVNALEYVVLPRVDNTVAYITSELDEQDREDFFRLKKVQSNKKKHQLDAEETSHLELEQLRLTDEANDDDQLNTRHTGKGREVHSILVDPEDADIFV
jgi:V-type H+-transporting ATPase subunit D